MKRFKVVATTFVEAESRDDAVERVKNSQLETEYTAFRYHAKRRQKVDKNQLELF